MSTQLDRLADEGANALLQLRRLDALRKVSVTGFLNAARELSGADDARLQELGAKIEERGGGLRVLARRLSSFFAGPHCPTLPSGDKLSKVVRLELQGLDGAEAEIGNVGATLNEVVAVAVLLATQHRPENFGPVNNWRQHQDEMARLRDRLNDIMARMREAYSPRDLLLRKPEPPPMADITSINPADRKAMDDWNREKATRDRGLRKHEIGPWLKRAPEITLANDDWPRLLLDKLLSADPAGAAAAARAEAEKAKSEADKRKKAGKGGGLVRKPIREKRDSVAAALT